MVSVNAFEGVDPSLLRRESHDFDGEGKDDRLARRNAGGGAAGARVAAVKATGRHTVAALVDQFIERRDAYGAGERWRDAQRSYFDRVILPAWGYRDATITRAAWG